MMKFKTTIFLLAGIAFFFLSGASFAKHTHRPIHIVCKDSVKIAKIPVDSLEAFGALKFRSFKKKAHASYYAEKFNGKRTASGSKFNNNKYTAAHRTLPFGTKLRITNEENGKCVIVEVTDRGPFSKGREIDITRRAFREICDNKTCGGLNVKIDVIVD